MGNSSKDNKYNQLVNEKSPYLLQHADNPVDWMPWSEKAFEKARKEDKPLFLSIGYSTCHWCHVMAHESFEDEEVAKMMNDTFVSIKVDREERPDIDSIYMMACQLMTGSGGWPLTIIMTPDKKPFFAGTYFPKNGRFGRAGLLDIIPRIKELWNNKRDELFTSGEQITLAIQDAMEEAPGGKLNAKTLRKAYNQLAVRFDEDKGGFNKRPKFPSPHNLLFLLRFWKRTGNDDALKMVEITLTEMRKGGIYDHIGFGFHRYSTDKDWLVPHFEKMLYDQALLTIAYIEAYQATKDELFAKTARETLEYVLRDMTSPEGGFYSAEDADSEGQEGKFYLWSVEEMNEILDSEDAEFIIKTYNLSKKGNFLEESTRKKTGRNILHLEKSYSDLAKEMNLELPKFYLKLNSIREKLFNHRELRIHPHKDDKILTDWNGLMIAALAKAHAVLGGEVYLKALNQSIEFIKNNLLIKDKRLLHRYRDGKAEIDAYVDDYSFLIWGLIEAYEATFNTKYLDFLLKLNEMLIKHYWDENIGAFYFTADDAENLIVRQKEIYDGAIPSGNSVEMLNLLRISYLTGDSDLEQKAETLGRVFSEKVSNNPAAHTQLMSAVDFAVGPSYTAVIAGDTNLDGTKSMLSEIMSAYHPNIVLIHRPTETYPPEIDKYASFIEWFDKLDDKPTAYICINKTCKPPTADLNKILEYINPKWLKSSEEG